MSATTQFPVGTTPQAAAWAGFVASELKTKPATNSNDYFLIGRSLLNKNMFNKLNDTEHDVVHGFQVVYGPFSTMTSMHEFIASYPIDWPGENEWRYIHPGQPEVLSSYFEPGKAEIVHNASCEFQGQIMYNEMTRKISEMKELQERMRKKEEKPQELTVDDLRVRIKHQAARVEEVESQLEQMREHLKFLQRDLESRPTSTSEQQQ